MLYPDFDDLISFKVRKNVRGIQSTRTVKSIVPGNHHSPFRGQGLEFDSVRQYVPGDDIRNIDWRVTARTGSPHLKLFKEERERHLLLCVDMNHPMRFGTKNTFKSIQAARVAAFLGWHGMSSQDRISACLYGDVENGIQFFPPKRTRKSFCALLKALSAPPRESHAIPLENVLEHISLAAHTGSLIYLISDFMELTSLSKIEPLASRLNKRCDVIFITINDLADKSIYPVGPIGCAAKGIERIYFDTSNESGRNVYAAQWRENRSCLYALTSRLKIPIIELTTESDVNQDLAVGLKNLCRRKKQ